MFTVEPQQLQEQAARQLVPTKIFLLTQCLRLAMATGIEADRLRDIGQFSPGQYPAFQILYHTAEQVMAPHEGPTSAVGGSVDNTPFLVKEQPEKPLPHHQLFPREKKDPGCYHGEPPKRI